MIFKDALGNLADQLGVPLSVQHRLGLSPVQGALGQALTEAVTQWVHTTYQPSPERIETDTGVTIDPNAAIRDRFRKVLITSEEIGAVSDFLLQNLQQGCVPVVRVGENGYTIGRNQASISETLAQTLIQAFASDPYLVAGVIDPQTGTFNPYHIEGY